MAVVALQMSSEESHAERVRRLKAEAQDYARRHARDLVLALGEIESYVADVLDGGEAYPVGVREAARQLAPELAAARLNIASILDRR